MLKNSYKDIYNTCKRRVAFTIAEALSVIILLGVIATITIPTTINRMTANQNRTKIKKALATYDSAIRLIVSENRITNKTRLDNYISANNCQNIYRYFKAIEQNGCVFKTADGVWWDVGTANNDTTISNVLVAFKRADLTKAKGWSETTNDAFYFHTEFDDRGALRIQDTQYSNFIGDVSGILDCAKTYAFLEKKKMYDYYKICQENDNASCMRLHNTNGTYAQVFLTNTGQRSAIRYGCTNERAEGCGNSGAPTQQLGKLNGVSYILGANCNTRGICEEDQYFSSGAIYSNENIFPENLKGKTEIYNNTTYNINSIIETKYNCLSSTTSGFNGCTGDPSYRAIFKNGTKGIQVFYTDDTRTTITKVSAFDDSNGYWVPEGTYECSNGATSVEACINTGL